MPIKDPLSPEESSGATEEPYIVVLKLDATTVKEEGSDPDQAPTAVKDPLSPEKSTEASKEPDIVVLESDSEVEIVEEVSLKPRPTPDVINVECKKENEHQIKREPKVEPGTTTNDPQDVESMKAHIKHLTNLLNQQMESQASKSKEVKKEPKESTPAPSEQKREGDKEPENAEPQSDTDEVIQHLEDYCANNQEQPDSETEARAENEQCRESEEDNTGVETVESSSQEDEIVVDPTNLVIVENQGEEPVNTQESADASNNNETQPKPAPATASHSPVTNSPDTKIQIHKVPVSFPAGGNLMEYPRTNVFITEALSTLVPDILPGNVIVHASLKDQMTSGQAVATVVLELKSSDYHDLIVKKIQEWYANDNIPRTEKFRFYVTDYPQRANKRSKETSESEKEPKPDKGRPTEQADKRKRKPSKDEDKPDQKRRRRGSPKPSSSREKESPKRESRTTRRETKSPRNGNTKPGATAREHRDVQAEEKIRVYREQREAIKAKLAHQDRETQNLIDRQAFGHKTQAHETKSKMKGKPQGSPKPGKSKVKTTPKSENKTQREKPQRSPEPGTSKKPVDKRDQKRQSKPEKTSSLWDSPGALTALARETPKPSKSGTPKKANRSPKAITSTPMPGAPKIDPNSSTDTLEKLVQSVTEIVPMARIDADSSTLDVSKLDMAMTVEVKNDHYTPPLTQEETETEQMELNKRATAHRSRIDTFRRWATNPEDEDLRISMRNQTIGSLDLRNKLKEKRKKSRRNSGPADLRNSVLNRDRDLRDLMRPRRNRSTPTEVHRDDEAVLEEVKFLEQSIVKQTYHLDSSLAETRKRLRLLENKIRNRDTKSESDHDKNITSATDSFDSNLESEGEVRPTEEEMLNIKYSDQRPESPKPKESKRKISPIKFPTNTPAKNEEDVPLSRMISRNSNAVRDLRHHIEGATSPDPFNRVPFRERLNREYPPRQNSPTREQSEWPRRSQSVWMPFIQEQRPETRTRNMIDPWLQPEDNRANQDTAHHSRNFIERQYTSRDEGTMTYQGPEAPDQGTPREGENKQH